MGRVGLGRGVAARLVAHGAQVHIWGRRENVLAEAVAEISVDHPGSAHYQTVNVRDFDAVSAAVDQIWNNHGPLTGMLNNAAAKKYDLEAWFPGGGAFRELVSASNCTDYQARAVEARLRTPKVPGEEAKKEYVHMLNSTLAATERALCCVLENWQTEDGVRVPDALVPHMPGGIDFIPFRKKLDGKGKVVPLDA